MRRSLFGFACAGACWLAVVSACLASPPDPDPSPAAPPGTPAATVRGLALPGAPAGGVHMDVIAYDPAHHQVWVPAGGTANVDVIDTQSDAITSIPGFPVREFKRHGHTRQAGPSAAALGDGVVYVANRGDTSVYAIDAETREIKGHVKLPGSPDLLAYTAATQEVWVTTPRDKALVVLEAGSLELKGTIELEGGPEGLVIDDTRGLAYTNLEDEDRTLTIDLHSHKVVHDWAANAGPGGPKCLALDRARDFLLVACPDHVQVRDAAHDGKLLGKIDTGAGVDSIDYVEARHELFAAAGRAGQLTIARLEEAGTLTPLAVVKTAPGARNAVATEQGVAYLTDSREGKILVVTRPESR